MKGNRFLILKRYGFQIGIVLLLCCFFVAALQLNRSLMIGFLAATVAFVTLYKQKRITFLMITSAVTVLILAIVILTVYVKTDSSLGRLLIYKISWQMFADHFLVGIGNGNFQIKYGLYQAAYFASGHYSTKELLLADNTYFAFNDYWQIIVEHGLIGLCVLVAMIYYLIKVSALALANQPDSHRVKLAVSLLIAIAIASFFTHIFEQPCFQSVAVLLIAYLTLVAIGRYLSVTRSLMLCLGIFAIIFTGNRFSYMANYRSYLKFEQAKELISIGSISEALSIYKAIFPQLKNDVVFLEAYVGELKLNGGKMEALKMLNYTLQKRSSNRLYKDLGELYFNTNQLNKAETAYRLSINMVPNRFTTRNELIDFYIKTGRLNMAKIEAANILYLPIKFNSDVVQSIRKKAKAVITLN